MLEKNITDFINYVAGHPGIDVASIADHFLSGNIETSLAKDIVIPDLIKLPPSKRALVVNIVRNKTNCNLYSDSDYQHNYVKIKEVGEVMREVPKFAKKFKWLFQ
jgi:hypothetical protein